MPTLPRMDVYRLPLYSKIRKAIELGPIESAPMTAWQEWLLVQSKNGISLHELSCLGFATSVGFVMPKNSLNYAAKYCSFNVCRIDSIFNTHPGFSA